MHRWTWLVLATGLAVGAGADEPEPGRTDGPEGSEYGTGGYRYARTGGDFYVEGFFGSATVESDGSNLDDGGSETDLVSGLNLGYEIEDWLAFQLGYGFIWDQQTNLFSGGMRSSYDLHPFIYFFSLDAELYSPDGGSAHFGIVPGVGAELALRDNLRVGLRYQRDFIFADDRIDINRFTAKLQFGF